MALSATFMIAVTANAAEAPKVVFNTELLTEETAPDYGADIVDGYDAYLVEVCITGVDMARSSANVDGRIMSPFLLSFSTDMSKIDGGTSFVAEEDVKNGASLAAGTTGFNIEYTGNPSRSTGFPKRNSSVAAADVTPYAQAIIYVTAGESATLTVTKLSATFSTYNAGTVDPSLTKTYDIADGSMGCDVKTLTLGEVKEETKTVGFSTVLDYVAGKTGVRFAVTTDDAAVTTKTKTFDVPFNTTVESKVTGCTIGLNVNEVPADVTLTATAELY